MYQPVCLAADNKNAGAQVAGDLFPTFYADTPDGERLAQEPLSQCARLGASVPVSGQKPGRFQVIYYLFSCSRVKSSQQVLDAQE